MMMRIVNPYLVAAVLEPFLLIEEREAALISAIDPQDEISIRKCIRQLLVPYFLSFDKKSQSAIKDSLGYMLLHNSDKWLELFTINHSPLTPPDPPIKFFSWLWEELFHTDICLDASISDYVVKEDIHAPNLILRGASA